MLVTVALPSLKIFVVPKLLSMRKEDFRKISTKPDNFKPKLEGHTSSNFDEIA